MGVFGGRDNFSSKWITAMVTDEQNRLHLVPIKNPLDDYFVAVINKEEYTFKIDQSRIQIWYATFTKSFRILQYTTAHYNPVSPADYKELELIIKKNDLPRMNRLQHTILSQIGRTEKTDFQPYKLSSLIKEMKKHPERNTAQMESIKNYLSDLNTDQIVTPVKRVTEFLTDDFIATDPKFVSTVPDQIMKAEEENRKVTNSEIGAKRSWRLVIALILGVGLIGGIIAFGISTGAFDGFGSMFGNFIPNPSGAPKTVNEWAAKFPTPESLRIAVDNGQVDPNTLPNDMKKMLDSFVPPTATPKSNTVNLTP